MRLPVIYLPYVNQPRGGVSIAEDQGFRIVNSHILDEGYQSMTQKQEGFQSRSLYFWSRKDSVTGAEVSIAGAKASTISKQKPMILSIQCGIWNRGKSGIIPMQELRILKQKEKESFLKQKTNPKGFQSKRQRRGAEDSEAGAEEQWAEDSKAKAESLKLDLNLETFQNRKNSKIGVEVVRILKEATKKQE